VLFIGTQFSILYTSMYSALIDSLQELAFRTQMMPAYLSGILENTLSGPDWTQSVQDVIFYLNHHYPKFKTLESTGINLAFREWQGTMGSDAVCHRGKRVFGWLQGLADFSP
jgi:hypothetical protein